MRSTMSRQLQFAFVLALIVLGATSISAQNDERPSIKNDTQPQEGNFNITGSGLIGESLGIGIRPQADLKLDVLGNVVFRTRNGNINFGSPNSETGMTFTGNDRADFRFDGTTLKILAGMGTGIPVETNGIAINKSGNVGIGTVRPTVKLEVNGNLLVKSPGRGGDIQFGSPGGDSGMTIIGANRADIKFDGLKIKLLTIAGTGVPAESNGLVIDTGGNVGIGTARPQLKLDVAGDAIIARTLNVGSRVTAESLRVTNGLSFATIAGTYQQDICRDIMRGTLGQCASSLRYKSDVQSYTGGLDILRRLRPISFAWNEGGQRDVGFGAEEVFAVKPLLTTLSDTGEVQGVKYKQLSVLFVNALKEQQAEVERHKEQIDRQQRQIDALMRLVCRQNPQAEACAR
jgi:hypothetical protein